MIQGLMQFPTITARNCLKLLGHMAACTYVVRHAKLRLHPHQSWLVSMQTCQGQLGQDRDPASPYPRLAPVVDGHSAGVLRSSLRCPTAIPSAGDGRIRFRLGSLSGGPQDSEPLVADRSLSSYQCQGGQNGAPSMSVIPPLSNRSMCIGHYGQYDWDDLYQQMGVHAPLPCARKPSGYGTFV